MNHAIKLAGRAVLAILIVTGALWWLSKGRDALLNQSYDQSEPPASIQTFNDFLQWQSEIRGCLEVDVRGVTYYHVIGPKARNFASGGALYVFDANGNYIGWSTDAWDVMRNEAVFYPDFWLSESSSVTEISLDELKERIPNESNRDSIRSDAENVQRNAEGN